MLLALLWPDAAWASTREFYFERLGSERGLTQGSVSAMVQDRQGFVWVGTQGGLHRFDGERYRVFRHDPGDPGSLPDSFVTALAAGADGHSIWVGTYSQYVARLDLRSGRIHRHGQATADRRAERQVMALLSEDEATWVGTVAGLDRIDTGSGARQRVLDLPTGRRVQPQQQLLRSRDGRLWYATGHGLYRLDPRATSWRRVSEQPALTLLEPREGGLLVGGADGLARWAPTGPAPVWPRAGAQEPAREVRAIVEDASGRIWFSAYTAGLRRFDPRSGRVVALRQDERLPGALPEDSINALLVDAGGMLWAGGQYRGAAVADPRGSAFPLVTQLDRAPGVHPAADDSIRALHGTPGLLWIGTDAGRFLRYDLRARRFDDLTPRLPPPTRRVAGFAPSAPGRLWLATGSGLVDLDIATGAMRRVPLGAYTQAVLRAIAADAQGLLWLGTSGEGALRYDPASGRVDHYGAGDGHPGRLSHPTVHALQVDRRGRVWIGTGDGLDLLDPGSGRLQHFRLRTDRRDSLPSNVIRALHEDTDGRMWVGTHAGLSRAVESPAGIRFEQPLVRALPERRSPMLFSLQEAPAGTLWAGTDAGLLRYRSASGEARLFGLGDGLQDLEFNGGASGRLADGRLAFGGVRGINLVDPRRGADDDYAGPLRLLSARSDGRDLDAAPWQPRSIAIPAGADLLRVRVGALDFAPSAGTRYRYRLDGFDSGWIDNGPQRDITYTQVPPGGYTLRAQSTGRDGEWSQATELRVPVHVATPLWRQPVVLLLASLLLLAPIAFAGWQWRQRRRGERDYVLRLREREERLNLALWASGEMFWDYDLEHHLLHRVQTDRTAPGRDINAHASTELAHRIHPDDLERMRQQLRNHLRGDSPTFESQHRIATPEGGWMWVRARGRVVERDASGRALRVAGTARDITATRRAERDRRVASEVLRSMAEAVAVFDDDFTFISVNPAFMRITGYEEPEVVGRTTALIDSQQHDAAVYRQMREDLRRDGRWSGELWQRRKDGSEFLCWLQASVVLDNAGQRGHWVAVLSDITDQKRAEQELRYLANYDTLTGLPNRALLSERLARAVARARRQESRLAVLFLDLDRFKDINDSLGHAAGDAILRATAARLQHAVGGQHTVARLGGDEFTVILEHIDDAEEAENVARQLLVAFEQPLDAGDLRDVVITPSIGISLFPDHADTPSDLLKYADTAMYQAKASGRRTFMRYVGSMDADVRRRASLSAALRKVIDRDELRLVYQPRLHVASGRLVGVEALLRWKSDEFGDVSPAHFIPLAEESGLILEIGEWALRRACEQLRAWRDAGIDASMSVNVSALQLRRGELSRVIEATLQETGLPAASLEIELTESVVMAEETWPALHAIRALGVRMSIDDFGTGYSSLAYLKRLPINTLKIDREFIGDLTRDADDEAITSAVIAMGHSLGLQVVAEGVETVEQLEFLRRYGCDEIQGYWLARPLEADACRDFLRDWTPHRLRAGTPAVAP